jgi:putative ABC transport system permease protein
LKFFPRTSTCQNRNKNDTFSQLRKCPIYASFHHPRANLIDRLLSGSNLWFARYTVMRPVILSLRNLLRHKGRLILTLITLAVAGAMFITIFNLRATILHSMTEMTQMQSFDLQVNFSQPYRSEEVRLAIAQIPEVQAVDNWLVIAAKRILPDGSEDDLSMTALKVDSSVISAPKILAGRWLSPGDGNSIVISSSILKNEPDLQVGQDILLKINNRHYTYTIVGEAMVSAGNTVFVSYPYTASLVNNYNWFSAFQIKMIPNADISVADLKIRLEQSLQASGFRIASIQTTTEMRDNIQSTFSSILILLMLMALLLAMVGGFGLMGTMSINVLERTREIGVLRAIGASNRGVTNVFMMEGVGIGLISCLFAIPLSFPITDLVARSIGMLAADAPWSGTFTASGVLIWIVTVIVLSLLANYLPARNAARLTVREVLAYE